MLNSENYNPDVLTCLANLSNDEVFTPPKLVNEILDMLPQELFSSSKTTFLDPVSKSGVFLREIAKRLIDGLEKEIPDLQNRLDHIFTKQLFGIAITELTSLLSRRSVYCSKKANSKYSVCEVFDSEQGNIVYNRIEHTWVNGKCSFCGASQENYERGDELETHAYQFIHTENPEELFNMKFDVIIGNPPYQLETGGSGRQAKPIYNLFVQQAKKMNPRYLTMIIPSRWFAGGMGLNDFRDEMLNDNKIKYMIDFTNAKDCFQGISVSGGVNYFLWEKDYNGPCIFTSNHDGKSNTLERYLNEFPVLVRYNEAVQIIHKVTQKSYKKMNTIVSSINPFGFPTSERGENEYFDGSVRIFSSKGWGFIERKRVLQGIDDIDKYKVIVSQTTSEHAGEPNKDGQYKLLSTVKVLNPGDICTFSYITIGSFENRIEADNLKKYLLTKFSRFMILQQISSIHISKEKFSFLPLLDFKTEYSDDMLYEMFDFEKDEIELIEALIRPMELDNE